MTKFNWRYHMNLVKPIVAITLAVLTTTLGVGLLTKPLVKAPLVSQEDIKCLAKNIYYESRGEPFHGQVAVAQVTVNRLNNGNFGNSICEVVYAKNQFSWTNNKKRKIVDDKSWNSSLELASAILNNTVLLPELKALYFHATHVKPKWAKHREKLTTIGKHIFYN